MGFLDDTVTSLRTVLAAVQNIDLWPPWDAVATLVSAVRQVRDIASRPPEPAPDDLTEAATAWRRIGSSVDSSCDDLTTCRDKVDVDAWRGTSGAAFRSSMRQLRLRTATVPPAARGVARALDTLATEMTAARDRHRRADDRLRDNLDISLGDLMPWELKSYVGGVIEGVVEAIREAIGAYTDASQAVHVAEKAIQQAMDDIDLPDALPSGVSPVSLVNTWNDEEGPLSGPALDRYDGAFADLSPAERQAVRDALAGAGSDEEVAWIAAGVASGLSGPALANYLATLHTLTPRQLDALDPPTDGSYVQPDTTTCGSSSLVMSHMLNDPAYALWMETGIDPETGVTDPRTPEQRFADESQVMHDRTNGFTDRGGRFQTPWPEAIGTAPWAVAGEMSSVGGSGVPGTDYDVQTVAPLNRGDTYDLISTSVESGHTVPLYVGDTLHPGHVVLVTGSDGDTLTIFDPASGQEQVVSRHDFAHGELGISGWDEPWFAVTPSS